MPSESVTVLIKGWRNNRLKLKQTDIHMQRESNFEIKHSTNLPGPHGILQALSENQRITGRVQQCTAVNSLI